MTPARMLGCLLLILVGYHHINEPIGFSTAGSIATGLFAACLTSVYPGYHPDRRNWIGWCAIACGCLLLAGRNSIDMLLTIPLTLVGLGFWLAELPIEPIHPHTGDGTFGGDGGLGGDGGGCDGGGDC
ncbi:MAG: hypothetical protein KDI27_10670 [Gammaproteobacteria bacterium]|nr:hypothetical protein [Gammaproteobacteria bacterium]MCP5416031.1 hypothetical protein [Chromatiaceae bacterium]